MQVLTLPYAACTLQDFSSSNQDSQVSRDLHDRDQRWIVNTGSLCLIRTIEIAGRGPSPAHEVNTRRTSQPFTPGVIPFSLYPKNVRGLITYAKHVECQYPLVWPTNLEIRSQSKRIYGASQLILFDGSMSSHQWEGEHRTMLVSLFWLSGRYDQSDRCDLQMTGWFRLALPASRTRTETFGSSESRHARVKPAV